MGSQASTDQASSMGSLGRRKLLLVLGSVLLRAIQATFF